MTGEPGSSRLGGVINQHLRIFGGIRVLTSFAAALTGRRTSILDGLYHEYSFFGARNKQAEGNFVLNQKAKSPIITAYIALAIAKAKEVKEDVSFVELFCADAYYAMVASRLGAARSVGIDNNRDGYADADKVNKIARFLDIANFTYQDADINTLGTKDVYDIVANVGGLYHVSNPEAVLDKSYAMAEQFLIIQTVVSLANEAPDYFEAPAPGWDWGCRYSRQSFDALIKAKGYDVVDRHFNILEGNARPEDRGSLYYLIQKPSATSTA